MSDPVPRTDVGLDIGAAKRDPGSRHLTVRNFLPPVAGLTVLAVMLEVGSRSGVIDERYLPAFSTVAVRAVGLLVDTQFLQDAAVTVLTFIGGLALATAVGVVAGVAFGLSDRIYRATRTVVELIRPVPPVALIPLAILVLGNGLDMKLAIALFAAVWPVLYNTMYGVNAVDPLAKDMARTFGKPWISVIRSIIIPSAGPSIFTGIRVSTTISLVSIITVELIAGGSRGLGAFISDARNASDPTSVYGGILITGLLGLLVNQGMARVEFRLFRWSLTKEKS